MLPASNPFIQTTNPFNPNSPIIKTPLSSCTYDTDWFLDKSKTTISASTATKTLHPPPNRRPPHCQSIENNQSLIVKSSIKLCALDTPYVATTFTHLRLWHFGTGDNIKSVSLGDSKCFALLFVSTKSGSSRLWLSLDKGELCDMQVPSGEIIERRIVHASKVIHILKAQSKIFSIDETGGLKIWSENAAGLLSLSNTSCAIRLSARADCAYVTHDLQLWIYIGITRTIEVYNLNEPTSNPTVLPAHCGVVCMSEFKNGIVCGHDDGKIVIYDGSKRKVRVLTTGIYKVSAILALKDDIWAGTSIGRIHVFTSSLDYAQRKDFLAYTAGGVTGLWLDQKSILESRLDVISLSGEGQFSIWDGLLLRDWLEGELSKRKDEYSINSELVAMVGTWNVDSMKPSDLQFNDPDFFESWLYPSQQSPPALFVLNFQEVIDLESSSKAAKQFFGIKAKKDAHHNKMIKQWEDLWNLKFSQLLPTHQFQIIASKQLVGLYMLVFASASIKRRIRDVCLDTVKTGLGGYHGNKGSIALRLLIDDSSVCFVNVHLAAHQSEISARNNDASAILRETEFKPLLSDYTVHGGDGTQILDHEIIIMSGDFNYRLDTLGRDQVIAAVEAQDWKFLLAHDQLCTQVRTNPYFALADFNEGDIIFAPTFKYDSRSDSYDTSEKRRVPAYCDRIMYRGSAKLFRYWRTESQLSDHRPVSVLLELSLKKIDWERLRDVKGYVNSEGYIHEKLKAWR